MRPFALAAALLALAVPALAQDPMIERAQETLRRMREAREAHDAARQSTTGLFSHFLKEPPPPPAILPSEPPPIPPPTFKPTGTIKVNGVLKVVVGSDSFGPGDIIEGWRVVRIEPHELIVSQGKQTSRVGIP